jgi:cell wall assembly regulator SMI1
MEDRAFDLEAFTKALADIDEWLADHSDPLKGERLAPGASDAQIAQAEQRVGAFPRELLELYRLHDGQQPRYMPITPWGYWADLSRAIDELPHMIDLYFESRVGSPLSRYEPLHPEVRARLKAGEDALTDDELTPEWWPLVIGNGEYIAVHFRSGRVFDLSKADPFAVVLVAGSLTEWLGEYADQLWDDEVVIGEHGGVMLAPG